MPVDLDALRNRLRAGPSTLSAVEGRVVSVRGLTVRAALPGARVGDLATIVRPSGPLDAEVVGFDESLAVLLPLGDSAGVGLDDAVRCDGGVRGVLCGDGVLGRVLGATGAPRDGLGPIVGEVQVQPLERAPPDPLRRQKTLTVMPLGVRAIDGLTTVVEGQRVGLFAEAGAGKTRLLARVARHASGDVVVMALVGERGREVREQVEGLFEGGAGRVCAVVSTGDEAPVLRARAASVAMAVAEFFRDRGARVLLVLDSVTRVARALREVGLAAGEPAVRRGFPPSVFAAIPRLLERAGAGERGSITALCTVLVEGPEVEDPVAEEVRATLDGHITLDRALGHRGRWPAIDVTRSLSRVMDASVTDAHRAAAARVRRWIAALDANRDLLAMGAWTAGRDKVLDEALTKREALEAFLAQGDEPTAFDETVRRLIEI
jgi:ATP synthase in type III secretion protein N